MSLVVLMNGIESHYEIENLLEVFVIKSEILFADGEQKYRDQISETGLGLKLTFHDQQIEIEMDGLSGVLEKRTLFAFEKPQRWVKDQLKKTVFELMALHFEPMSKWGILVGIRPVKIVHEMMDEGLELLEIKRRLAEDYLIKPEKIQLMTEVALSERPFLYPNDTDAISLYICIPFCPTRCLYCSFPSNDLKQKGKLLPLYLEKLAMEIEVAIDHIKHLGKRVDCIYIGGGTPTSIDEAQLEALLSVIAQHVSSFELKEFTVEAGRPDTITRQKLEIMQKYGVDRICINPQTMNDQTLITIGRNHHPSDISDVMRMARSVGFKSINMDIIIGLPGEQKEQVDFTVHELLKFNPENITIHTLAVKRASKLNEDLAKYELIHDSAVEDMMHHADVALRDAEYAPYYMYRQKKMVGHLENVGYAKRGFESLYNMRIMEEKHSIVACGAGAVSKICEPSENRFERVANFKGLEDYLNRFDEILEKKKILK